MADVEFTPYIERRARTEAFQFLSVGQVESIAFLLRATDYTLHGDSHTFHVDLVLMRDGQMIEARVNRGDFIKRVGWGYEIVPCFQFHDAWEEDK